MYSENSRIALAVPILLERTVKTAFIPTLFFKLGYKHPEANLISTQLYCTTRLKLFVRVQMFMDLIVLVVWLPLYSLLFLKLCIFTVLSTSTHLHSYRIYVQFAAIDGSNCALLTHAQSIFFARVNFTLSCAWFLTRSTMKYNVFAILCSACALSKLDMVFSLFLSVFLFELDLVLCNTAVLDWFCFSLPFPLYERYTDGTLDGCSTKMILNNSVRMMFSIFGSTCEVW